MVWPQRGQSVSLPLGSTAPLVSNGTPLAFSTNASGGITGRFELAVGAAINDPVKRGGSWGSNPLAGFITGGNAGEVFSGLYADLSKATAATINAIRTAFQVQKLLERDAREAELKIVSNVPGFESRVKYLKSRIQDLNNQIFPLVNK